ncbi:glycosyltransferase family 90 protein [Melanomma pulvis-pyrius CBS 109.77]|uniref:Glycosyltransferase family 90 protein n=1 Tax=Melanomma pulvis-pyrius CBS 109.77 TaxID=1314802 RepID=A0A6A6XLP5_9PLEO|nr:glycosyltransferase family 90 protein [Melanomma pulvis-pyrius CBS 109.77]
MFRKVLLFPCGLVVGACHLSAGLDTSFALDRPLHTIAVVLLLLGLTIVAHGALTSRNRAAHPKNYTAIPLSNGLNNGSNNRPGSRDASPFGEERMGMQKRTLGTKALVGLLGLLLLAICARLAIYQRMTRNMECAGPTAMAFLPLVLAVCHSLRGFGKSPIWNADQLLLDRALQFTFHHLTRYILPSFLLFISSFMVTMSTIALRSTYICPLAHAAASVVHWLQFLGFLIDCVAVLVLYRLLDDVVVRNEDTVAESKDGARNIVWIGLSFVASALGLVLPGVIAYAAFPEHREWLLTASPEYFTSLSILSFMIPFTTLCFLYTIQLYATMSTMLILAFSIAYTQVFQALRVGVSYAFPPKPSTGLALPLMLLTTALILYLIVDTAAEGQTRSKFPIRFGRFQIMLAVLVAFALFVVGLGYRPDVHGGQISSHPITTLIGLANETHGEWASQAHQSRSLPEAVGRYRERYFRDPPPGFEKWYEYATSRNSVIIDDFDNIEIDLAPFSSLSPAELRSRTAEILADNNGLGGISIRGGKADVFSNVPGTHRWMVDGTIQMIEKFSEFLPDMDVAMNLNDECRVAVPFTKLQEAHAKRELYPDHKFLKDTINFSSDRSSNWLKISKIPTDTPSYFKGVGFNPTFKSYGSIACPPDSPARRERHGNMRTLCTPCAAPHSMGAFVSNWSISASPCHQPDLANLHGLHLSPSAFVGTHDLVPIFSQSRAPGYADIRYPSPWNYLDKAAYEFDDRFPDPPFAKKENTLFWRGATSEGVSAGAGAWRGMLRQRLVHLLNNGTHPQPILLPRRNGNAKLEYIIETPETIKRLLATKTDVRFVGEIARCGGADCADQVLEFGSGNSVDFKQHWRYRYLFDADGAGFSGRFIPFLQSNSVVFKSALFREWYEGRLTAWKHFVPVDLRLHDLFSSLAYFGGYGIGEGQRKLEGRENDAAAIASAGRVWAKKVLRKEDMEIYFFRLLLEWGRLTDENRRELGFRVQGERGE